MLLVETCIQRRDVRWAIRARKLSTVKFHTENVRGKDQRSTYVMGSMIIRDWTKNRSRCGKGEIGEWKGLRAVNRLVTSRSIPGRLGPQLRVLQEQGHSIEQEEGNELAQAAVSAWACCASSRPTRRSFSLSNWL
jgi:hypothetical protein